MRQVAEGLAALAHGAGEIDGRAVRIGVATLIVLLAAGLDPARCTLFGSMSSRKRRNTGARKDASSVQFWNFTSATTFGSTQIVGFGNSGRSIGTAIQRQMPQPSAMWRGLR